MQTDQSAMTDGIAAAAGYGRGADDESLIHGHGVLELRAPDGSLKQRVEFTNLVTQVGDQVYGELGSGAASPNTPTGMRLGTGGGTAAAKTGAGAAIVTYVSGSNRAFEGGFPSSALQGSSRRIAYQSIWAAGVATANGIDEVVITNETPLTDVAGVAANTISRAVLGTVVNKAAGDSLTITWNHDLLGS